MQVPVNPGPQGGSILRDLYPYPALQPPPHLQTRGKATVRIRHRQELRPLGAPGRGRGREPEPKGDPTEPEGQPSPDKDNFQVPWSSPPIGRLGGRRARRGILGAVGEMQIGCPGLPLASPPSRAEVQVLWLLSAWGSGPARFAPSQPLHSSYSSAVCRLRGPERRSCT